MLLQSGKARLACFAIMVGQRVADIGRTASDGIGHTGLAAITQLSKRQVRALRCKFPLGLNTTRWASR